MNNLLLVFISCIFLMTVMVIYRLYELITSKNVIPEKFRQKSDLILEKVTLKIIRFLFRSWKKTVSLKNSITGFFKKTLYNLKYKVPTKISSYFEKLRKSPGIGKKGSVSLYFEEIKKIRESKNSNDVKQSSNLHNENKIKIVGEHD